MNHRSRTRLPPIERKAQIIAAALELSRTNGFYKWGWNDLIEKVGINGGAIRYHFPSLRVIRRRMLSDAINRRDLDIVIEAVRHKHPFAKNLPPDLGALVTKRLKS